jgi:CubicO group peptidase (beta-lactamase class C family)
MTLGFLIRNVSHQFYGDFLAARIFQPLGMTPASPAKPISSRTAPPDTASSRANSKIRNGSRPPSTPPPTAPSTSPSTTSPKGTPPFTPPTSSAKPPSTKSGPPSALKTHPYSFGWFIVQIKGHRLIHHGGAWQGFQSSIHRYTDDKLTIIAFANLDRITRGVAALHLPALKPDGLTPTHPLQPSKPIIPRSSRREEAHFRLPSLCVRNEDLPAASRLFRHTNIWPKHPFNVITQTPGRRHGLSIL